LRVQTQYREKVIYNNPSLEILMRANFQALLPTLTLIALLQLVSCRKPETTPAAGKAPAADNAAAASLTAAARARPNPDEPSPASKSITLPINLGRRTDDLDVIIKKRNLRALVMIDNIGFFYDKGRPRGTMYEALQELQTFANKKFKLGTLDLKITFLPTSPSQIEAALNEGLGDFIAYGVAITPEREKVVAFTTPLQKDVTRILVTGPDVAPITKAEDISGKEVWVNPIGTAHLDLKKMNESLQKSGKPPISIQSADTNLGDDDLVQMVNAGLIPATVTTKIRAEFWAQVMDHVKAHPGLAVSSGVQLAWVLRKNNPQLKQLLDEFTSTHSLGTTYGNVMLRRYFKDTKWIKNSTSAVEMKKFQDMAALFQKYAGEYDFDYLMLAALGYQESLLDQSRTNPSGAVGIMQVIPKYAAASPINVPSVATTEGNIHAGTKMLRNISDTYFKDPKIDPLNRTLFVFAGYNAGPNRIGRLRKQAADAGLDPNIWFGNVELIAAKEIGQETVTYVANIYKYYISYKMTVQQAEVRKKATAAKQK
jgi:membrane-bound lytic murein transglycosylase MltF